MEQGIDTFTRTFQYLQTRTNAAQLRERRAHTPSAQALSDKREPVDEVPKSSEAFTACDLRFITTTGGSLLLGCVACVALGIAGETQPLCLLGLSLCALRGLLYQSIDARFNLFWDLARSNVL
jgi:hypothetical protein